MSDIPVQDQPSNGRRDDDLLSQVREAHLRLDPPPASVQETAIRALAWDVELEKLAELTFDSALEPSGLRSNLATRDYIFQFEGVTVELTVERTDDGAVLIGDIEPVASRSVAVLRPAALTVEVDVDAGGHFEVNVDGLAAAVAFNVSGQTVRTELFRFDPEG